jgi:hypothetical protein
MEESSLIAYAVDRRRDSVERTDGRLKRFTRKGLKVVLWLSALAGIIFIYTAARHGYEVRHIRIVYLDDAQTLHPNGISGLSAKDAVSAMAFDSAFDDFTAAFAEDPACSNFTLVRDTQAQGGSWSFPYAYWFLMLTPVVNTNGDTDREYSQIGWDISLNIGDEIGHSRITQGSETAKDAAH